MLQFDDDLLCPLPTTSMVLHGCVHFYFDISAFYFDYDPTTLKLLNSHFQFSAYLKSVDTFNVRQE